MTFDHDRALFFSMMRKHQMLPRELRFMAFSLVLWLIYDEKRADFWATIAAVKL